MLDVLKALDEQGRRRPDAAALIDDERVVTYRELCGLVGGLSRTVADLPQAVGIFAPNCLEWVVADLALSHAGKTVVPLPVFFSPRQSAHIIADAEVGHVLTIPQSATAVTAMGVPYSLIDLKSESPDIGEARPSDCIIYTSGTTGRPKGVRLGERQINRSAAAISQAVAAAPEDRYLSVLPFSLLLERICGICAPLLAGAPVCLAKEAAASCVKGDPAPLIEASERFRPTISVLTPDLLKAWTIGLAASGKKAPTSLRLVAVGGAPVYPALAEAAWKQGIPAYEGYGLSECCSVVALNRPQRRLVGTVGVPINGIKVTIEDGEIVVAGPTVMNGYLHDRQPADKWRTGDLGALDDNGFLTVYGRKDNVLVTSAGRNINPEWIEDLILADPKISQCIIAGHGRSTLTAIVAPSKAGADWFAENSYEKISGLLAGLCAEAPEYARPRHHIITDADSLRDNELLTPNGRPHRKNIAGHFAGALCP